MNSGIRSGGGWFSKLFRVCLGAGIFLLLTGFCFVGAAADLTGMSARQINIREYNSKDLSLNLEIQAGRLRMDHERRGFFRIGVLPIFIAEDVRIRIASPACLSQVLPAMNTWRPSESFVRRMEIRHLGISFLGKKYPRLNAAVARPEASGALVLTDVCLQRGAGISKHIPQATLWMTGPQAGRIRWQTPAHRDETTPFSVQLSTQK